MLLRSPCSSKGSGFPIPHESEPARADVHETPLVVVSDTTAGSVTCLLPQVVTEMAKIL